MIDYFMIGYILTILAISCIISLYFLFLDLKDWIKAAIRRRQEATRMNRNVKKWSQIKGKDNQDIENRVTEDTCQICLEEFADNDKVR